MDRFVYLDYAATAPLSCQAFDAMSPLLATGVEGLRCGGANANSLYGAGRDAFRLLEQARRDVAEVIGANRPTEIVFTSGATEADNAALFGLVDACMLEAEQRGNHDCVPQVVISSIEHDAVLKAARVLNQWGAHIVFVEPNSSGHITPEALESVMNEHTILVSVMAVNNEIGSVMDIAALASVAHQYGALFHTDATQALGKIPVSMKEWGVDAASFSSHKVGGPKGVGALYIKNRTPFSPQIVGGGQESAQRSGTQNVAGIVGFAAACKHSCALRKDKGDELYRLRDYCYEKLREFSYVKPTVSCEVGSKAYSPHIVNVLVDGFESETMILRLDNEGVCVSGGSACSSHSLEPSHVLRAMGVSRDSALTSLRVSIGYETTKDDIEVFLDAFARVTRMR